MYYGNLWMQWMRNGSECGMAVNATCAKCDAPLVNDMLTIDDGKQVQISKCPNDHGKIKSPTCCGKDMTCTTWIHQEGKL